MQYATENIIPVTLELGCKSPNIFFPDVSNEDDAFFDRAIVAGDPRDGATMLGRKRRRNNLKRS